ncbi:MAG: SDR family NAD(P)-dependent oxidoreductase [Polyangiaceae bacterium]
MTVENPVVVITGASMGIGRALALRWASDGARIAIQARDRVALERVAREVTSAGGLCIAEAGDVTNAEDCARLIERTKEEFGRIDILVNNAGRGYYAGAVDIDLKELADLFSLNVIAPLRLTQLAMNELIASKGVVVMMSSIAGVAAAPNMGAYAATKFALEAVSMSLRAELSEKKVAVVVVRPGPVDTPFRKNSITAGVEAGVRPSGAKSQSAEDVAEMVVHGVKSRSSIVETSLFVNVGSFASRVLPPIFRVATARMAKRKG